jgi:hypothetical protein
MHRDESLAMPDPSTVPVAPIQVVRNMHSWITGQPPDGKTETASHGNSSMVSLEASAEGPYIRSSVMHLVCFTVWQTALQPAG